MFTVASSGHHVNIDFVFIYIQKPPSETKSNKVEKNLHKKFRSGNDQFPNHF